MYMYMYMCIYAYVYIYIYMYPIYIPNNRLYPTQVIPIDIPNHLPFFLVLLGLGKCPTALILPGRARRTLGSMDLTQEHMEN